MRTNFRRVALGSILALNAVASTGCIAAIAKANGSSQIEITSNVPAAVLVDGREVGMTPIKISPKPKEVGAPMLISVLAEGYLPVTERITQRSNWKAAWPALGGAVVSGTMIGLGMAENEFGEATSPKLMIAGAVVYGVTLADIIYAAAKGATMTYTKTKINAQLLKED